MSPLTEGIKAGVRAAAMPRTHEEIRAAQRAREERLLAAPASARDLQRLARKYGPRKGNK